jgi:hypothetical protein
MESHVSETYPEVTPGVHSTPSKGSYRSEDTEAQADIFSPRSAAAMALSSIAGHTPAVTITASSSSTTSSNATPPQPWQSSTDRWNPPVWDTPALGQGQPHRDAPVWDHPTPHYHHQHHHQQQQQHHHHHHQQHYQHHQGPPPATTMWEPPMVRPQFVVSYDIIPGMNVAHNSQFFSLPRISLEYPHNAILPTPPDCSSSSYCPVQRLPCTTHATVLGDSHTSQKATLGRRVFVSTYSFVVFITTHIHARKSHSESWQRQLWKSIVIREGGPK